MKVRKKPVEVEAIQWTGYNTLQVKEFVGEDWENRFSVARFQHNDHCIAIKTLEGTMKAVAGDWIIRGVQGEYYPCKPDIFEATYEQVTEMEAIEERFQYTLTFDELREKNLDRCNQWHIGGFLTQADARTLRDWSGADWANAMQAEAGEAGNVVKKLRRIETGVVGQDDPDYNQLVNMLIDEVADTQIYLDLLCAFYEISLADAVIEKFNRDSEKRGFPQRLGE